MADKGFGVKEINLIGASGTPTIESPNNLNLNAVNVAISTDTSIGGQVGIADTIFHIGDTNTKIRFPAADVISFERGGGEALRITTANALLTAGVTAEPLYPHYTTARKIQAEIKGAIDTGQTRHHGSLAVNCTNSNSFIGLVRSDNTQTDGTDIGVIGWTGFDGTDFHQAAAIMVKKGAGAGNDDQPGHMIFKTNSGTTSATERVRILSDGHTLFSGVTSNVDTRNVAGITVKSPGGISLKSFGANGSRNWRIRPDDLNGWADLDFSCAPTDGASDWPDAAADIVLALEGDTKDVIVKNGNLKIGVAGKGIDFSAQTQSSSTTDDEILDHYEKGKWTPVMKKNGVANATPDIYHGRYVRVGKKVWLSCYMRWNSGSNAQGTSGGWTLHGLPFSIQDDNPGTCRIYQFAPIGYFTIDSDGSIAYGHDSRWQCNNSTYFDLYTDISSSDLAWGSGSMQMSMTGTFMIHE